MRMLNLGCGATFHDHWVNMDFTDHGGKVIAYDLRLGIPFADETFDVVYHSHVLEHFPKAWGEFFLQECLRVLRPGGLLRVVVPDLENIVRAYLQSLDAAKGQEDGAENRHQWMLVELIDQLTRTHSGGEMLNYWKQNPIPEEKFVLERVGKEAELGIASVHGKPPISPSTALPPVETDFLLSGELHKWMYDSVSLGKLLREYGFVEIQQKTHNESALPHILQYGLDSTPEGGIRKPDSLFMEAKKAQASSKNTTSLPRIAMFSTSDGGGAGITCVRLHKALRALGVPSHMYVAQQQFFQDRVHIIPSRITAPGGGLQSDGHRAEKCLRKELIPYNHKLHHALTRYPQRPAGSEHFSMPGQVVPLHNVPFLEDFDVLHFEWVAGMLDPSLCLDFLKGKKIVWSLHDMGSFTGGCHYSNGCRKFEDVCGACPELGSQDPKDLAFETWKARMTAYRELDMHIVAPSAWLAEQAQKSSLFKRFPVHVIPYSHPVDTYKPLNREQIRASLGISPDRLVLFFASQSLTNTRKGGIYLVMLLQLLAKSSLKDRITVLLLGHNPSREFTQSGIHVESLGFMDEPTKMVPLYNAADAMVVPSLEDNQPNVIAESLMCGTPVIAFANTGMQEMVRHNETGFLAENKNVEQLLHGILWADKNRQNPLMRKICRAYALERWAPTQGAGQFLEL